MSMSKLECFIDYYKTHYEMNLYNCESYEMSVLDVLNKFGDTLDILSRMELDLSTWEGKKVKELLEEWN